MRVLPRGSGELILVIDDEEPVRTVARATLERFGYRVLLAANGAEGVAQFASHRADIAAVVTDMAMPVMEAVHSGDASSNAGYRAACVTAQSDDRGSSQVRSRG